MAHCLWKGLGLEVVLTICHSVLPGHQLHYWYRSYLPLHILISLHSRVVSGRYSFDRLRLPQLTVIILTWDGCSHDPRAASCNWHSAHFALFRMLISRKLFFLPLVFTHTSSWSQNGLILSRALALHSTKTLSTAIIQIKGDRASQLCSLAQMNHSARLLVCSGKHQFQRSSCSNGSLYRHSHPGPTYFMSSYYVPHLLDFCKRIIITKKKLFADYGSTGCDKN